MRLSCWTALLGVGALVLSAGRAPALEREAVNKAIDRGVAALRKMQRGGTWPHQEIGATALAGLTLLECGVPADDKAVRSAADAVRRSCPSLERTYSVALAILFLDRLGDANDQPLIDALTVRLLASQTPKGGWPYTSPVVGGEAEQKRLMAYLKDRPAELRTRPAKRPAGDIAKEVLEQFEGVEKGTLKTTAKAGDGCDNSNTQFAILALWVARRNGLPVDAAIERTAKYFRDDQLRDGGWGYYRESADGSTATMTCSGVLGLAVAYGAASERYKEKGARLKLKVADDPALRAGLAALATVIDHPASKRKAQVPRVGGRAYYFLWGLERVAMVLDLDTIGGKDWYTWGAEILLANQQDDGSWKGEYGECGADTCFALLFLKRSNLASDLTASLKSHLNEKPELRSGGLGGDRLVKEAAKIKPGFEIGAKGDSGNKPDERPKPMGTEESAGRKLAREFLDAPPERRERMLADLRDGKGVVNTEALALAIPRLSGADKRKAREALSDRLTRMKTETLSKYLKDEDAEIRRAAAWACACKDNKVFVPELIELLNDPEPTVAFTAHAALKELTGQKFPFDPRADAADKAKAIEQWKKWWAGQKG